MPGGLLFQPFLFPKGVILGDARAPVAVPAITVATFGFDFGNGGGAVVEGSRQRLRVAGEGLGGGVHVFGPTASDRLPGKNGVGEVPAFLTAKPVSYTHLRAHETRHDLVCRLLLEK